MKKIVVLLTMILVLTGCGSKAIDITFKSNEPKMIGDLTGKVLNTSEETWKDDIPTFDEEYLPFFLGWMYSGEVINIEAYNFDELKKDVVLVAKWDEEALQKYVKDKEEKAKIEKEKRLAKEREEAAIKAKEKEQENEEKADEFISMASAMLEKNFEGRATHDVYKETLEGKKIIKIRMNVTDSDTIDAFAYNITKGMFKDEMKYFMKNLKSMEREMVSANKSDRKIVYIINNPANEDSMLYFSVDGITSESLFQE
ncbi:hypothetical protein [Erysipelothrix sp. P66]|uniref:hypothetical protein n=1 Tax=Erysipelothrix sp. P66 TaxID=3141531 RepID=UPI00315DB66A